MLKSLVHTDNPFCSTQEIHQWILRRNQEVHVSVEEIPFAEMEGNIIIVDYLESRKVVR